MTFNEFAEVTEDVLKAFNEERITAYEAHEIIENHLKLVDAYQLRKEHDQLKQGDCRTT